MGIVKITPSRRTDHALQAMTYLASAGKARTAAPEIAKQMGLPVHHLRQVLRELTRARLVMSSPAPSGGYGLARSADAITVLEIAEALEGRWRLTSACCAAARATGRTSARCTGCGRGHCRR